MERILLDSMTNVYNLLYNFWRLFSIVLTILNSDPKSSYYFLQKNRNRKKKSYFMGNGNAYNRLNSFLLSLPVWLEDGYTACTKRVVPLFPYSAAGSYVLACALVHISYDCTRALYGSPTHTSRPTRCHVTIRIHGCSPEWTSLVWLEKEDLTRWTDRGSICEKSL